MSNFRANDPLLLAGKIITLIAQGACVLGGLVLAALIPVMLFMQDTISAEVAAKYGEAAGAFPGLAFAGVFLIGLTILALAFMFFGKLRRIIGTVGEGDPFAPANAKRLNNMAWLMLGVQILMIPAGALGFYLAQWADEIETANINIDGGVDGTGILMVIVLFILARVFRHGTAMREDLEGTV
ncbi:DUF2975 domain-containing protein [Pontixanthobacter aquaemixtae]|uniref:DUF2975 domain-containing protein n=1 Tax=Pontixanthobacter aquaemixtae TaxID=1958940 RepID=A0A844ZW06_9SPHN|nr:DUF2975 domain-containing protein [Pontixanthobacter aquaemixtae]MXO91136.1 DUF2975 domain-containing protein [Pontixanthobacter aquaemixtae]